MNTPCIRCYHNDADLELDGHKACAEGICVVCRNDDEECDSFKKITIGDKMRESNDSLAYILAESQNLCRFCSDQTCDGYSTLHAKCYHGILERLNGGKER